jgi:hypothetical protein
VGRYNDLIGRQDIDDVDENEEYADVQEEDGCVNNDSIENTVQKVQTNQAVA